MALSFVRADPSLMHGDVVRLVAFYLVLRLVRRGVVRVPLVIRILRMNFDNPAADMSGLGIPGHVIADFESFYHLVFLQMRKGAIRLSKARISSAQSLLTFPMPDGPFESQTGNGTRRQLLSDYPWLSP